ncbi:hypothetical protein D3C76_1113820 [compost metagenome]
MIRILPLPASIGSLNAALKVSRFPAASGSLLLFGVKDPAVGAILPEDTVVNVHSIIGSGLFPSTSINVPAGIEILYSLPFARVGSVKFNSW